MTYTAYSEKGYMRYELGEVELLVYHDDMLVGRVVLRPTVNDRLTTNAYGYPQVYCEQRGIQKPEARSQKGRMGEGKNSRSL